MRMKLVYALLKMNPKTGRCDLLGSPGDYQYLAADGESWTDEKLKRTWETWAEAEAFAGAAGLPDGSWEVVPRYATGPDGNYVFLPEDDPQ